MKLVLPLLILMTVVLGCGDRQRSSTYKFDNESISSGPKLKLLSVRGTIEHGYITVEGEVENISGEKLENVQAVAIHYDANGSLVTSDDALVEYNPMMPGQRSPFSVGTRYNPAMKTFNIDFKYLMGETIFFVDGRPLPKEPKKKKK